MNPAGHHHHRESITELDQLLTADERRTVSVDRHAHFIRCISTDDRGVDEIDRFVAGHHEWRESIAAPRAKDEIDDALDDMIEVEVDPYSGDPPSRRSDRELNRVLSILDELEERGNG